MVKHYFCDICDLRQPNQASLFKHMCVDHGEAGQSFPEKVIERKVRHKSGAEKNLSESCPVCDEPLGSVTDLVSHACDFHEFKGKVKQKVFPRFNDYEQWRKKMEEENITTWMKRRVVRPSTGSAYYENLRCHRSLNTRLHTRKSELQSQDTEKEKKSKRKSSTVVQRSCTSFINVKRELTTDVTIVEFCLEHFGHEQEPQKLILPWSARLEIADMLSQNLSPSDIVRILKEKQRNADNGVCMLKRQYWVTKKDVYRVAADLRNHPHKYGRMEGASPELPVKAGPDSFGVSTAPEFIKAQPSCSSPLSILESIIERELYPKMYACPEEALFKADHDPGEVSKKLLKKEEPCSAFSIAEVVNGPERSPIVSASPKVLLNNEPDPDSAESSSATEKLFFKKEPISSREPSPEEAKPPIDEGVRVFSLAVAPDGKGFTLVDHSPCVDVPQDDL
ncbi:unnamed protein product [Heligmosomoides polygyrus]|uniref:C2H2-type domain-containing protein n=1 Tax=Heligmosomoides polygyrus TaxID=6339 RepID=A0A183FJC7_HELPZ|nr:unnamed protein product [Heligmosomoides polygyrus]